MLLALHTGLLAAVQAAKQPQQQQQGQQQQQQGQQQQQQQQILAPSGVLLCSLLRVLSVLVAVAPYDRLPNHLLPDVVSGTYELWQQLQQQLESPSNAAAAAAAGGVGDAITAGIGTGSGTALVAEEVPTATAAAVAVLAQALSTKKPCAGLAAWLEHDKTTSAAAATSQATSIPPQQGLQAGADLISSSRELPRLTLPANSSNSNGMPAGQACSGSSSSSLVANLLSAAVSPRPLLRIEALAALRGCCINYPAALPVSTATTTTSSSSSSGVAGWPAVLAAVSCSLAATQQVPRTPRGTPVANGSSSSSAASTNSSSKVGGSSSSSDEVSASTSPEDKAAQHAVKLIGDWMAAAWKLQGLPNSSSSSSNVYVPAVNQDCQQQQQLVQQWSEALELLLSDQIQQHPSYMIRSAAAAVTADTPAPIWQALPATLQQQVLETTARAAQTDSVAAARSAACKVLGSLVLLPGVLAVDRQQQLQQLLLAPLGKRVRDSTVSVRLSASWAVANACDALKAACGSSSSCLTNAAAAAPEVKCAVAAPALQLLCEASLAAAADSEKVRANGIRAVGALLAGWQPDWGLASSSSSTQIAAARPQAAVAAGTLSGSEAVAAAGAGVLGYGSVQAAELPDKSASIDAATVTGCAANAAAESPWLPGWLRSAVGQLQSCLASRSPKVVWNAAYAAAGLLQNSCLHARAEVSLISYNVLCHFVTTCVCRRLANNAVRGA
jgi:hypothetical protein